MKDESKTKARLIEELNQLRRKTAQLEDLAAELQRPEEALGSGENRYQTLVEESFDGIFVQKGVRIVFVNSRLCEMLGYEENQLVGLDHWRVYHPDYQELTRTRAEARLRGEEAPSRYEVRLQKKDGSSFDGEIRARAIVLEGEPGIQVWVRDITDRQRAEEEIRRQSEQLLAIMDSMEDGVNIVDGDFNVQYVNPLLIREYGPPEGKKCYQYFHQRQEKCKWCRHEETLAGKILHWEWTAPKSGRIYDLIDTPMQNADGTMSKLQIWRDITEHKRAEGALRDSEERLRSAMEAAADPFVIYDMEGRATYVNPAFTRLFGWTADELLGKRIDFVPPDTLAESKRLIDKVLAGELVSGFETRRYSKTGEVIEVSLSGACYRDRDGRPRGLVASLRDITAGKRAEEALRESEDRYRRLVEVSPDCVLVYQDTKIVFANPAAAAVLGA
ncbi:MAG: PAS domain S-box protein, partial [Proteobacteria bacterium]|nr:PAS domain S-box protein [Pseudomonadota bacterium]